MLKFLVNFVEVFVRQQRQFSLSASKGIAVLIDGQDILCWGRKRKPQRNVVIFDHFSTKRGAIQIGDLFEGELCTRDYRGLSFALAGERD